MLQPCGKHAILNSGGTYHELNKGDRIEVDTGEHWIGMRVGHNFEEWIFQLPGKLKFTA